MDQQTTSLIILGLPIAHQVSKAAANVAEDFLKRVLGPLADAKGKQWAAAMERTEVLVARASELVLEAGIDPTPVPGRVLFPLLQAACIEDDSGLRRQWATLLANAADPSDLRNVTPSFVSILKDLSPTEALILELLYSAHPAVIDFSDAQPAVLGISNPTDGSKIEVLVPYGSFQALSDNLQRLGLAEMRFGGQTRSGASVFAKIYRGLPLTPFGTAFVAACTKPPKDRTPA